MKVALPLLCSLAVLPAPRQDDPPPQEPERAESWPALVDRERVEKDVSRLRKANTEEMGEQAHAALVADGAMVAPLLLKALGKERDADARDRLRAVLDAVVAAPHTRLLAEWFDHEAVAVRVWTQRAAARWADPGLAAAARSAWQAVAKRGERAEEDERFAAALLLVSTGDTEHLEPLYERGEREWSRCGAELARVFGAVRGRGVERELVAALKGAERRRASVCLRLLAACGTRGELNAVAPFLDSNDSTLRIDAINACRGIVDGEAPLERLAVFEAIEMAKRWRERLK